MPLFDRTGLKHDDWTRADTACDGQCTILPWLEGQPAMPPADAGTLTGVDLPNSATQEQVVALLPRLALVVIAFPGFGDGRGFTLARRLRRAGFAGILRAAGPLIPDQFAYALACGFDEIELPQSHFDRQPIAQWLQAIDAISSTYQRGYVATTSILDQRRQQRRGAIANV
jgi:uncharacterized protein (DUF934 family)